jgi:hypothetical protein
MSQTILIPAPPVPLSASASLLQTVTINTQMRNIARSSSKGASLGHVGEGESILLFEPSEQAKRIGPAAARARFTQQVQYTKNAMMGVSEELKPQGVSAAQRLHAIEAYLEDTDVFSSSSGAASILVDPGRMRAMCSSPRDMAMRGVWQVGLAAAAGATSFATSYTQERFLEDAASAVSPKKALALQGAVIEGMRGFGMQDDGAACATADAAHSAEVIASAHEQSGAPNSNSPRTPRGGTCAFRSTSARFTDPPRNAPPVGHYSTRYKAVDGEPRAPAFQGRYAEKHRGGSPSGDGAGATLGSTMGTTSAAGVGDGGAPPGTPAGDDEAAQQVTKHDTTVPVPVSAREAAKLRLSSAPPKPPKPEYVFVSKAPRLAVPTVLPQSVKAPRQDFYPPVMHHDDRNSQRPRVHSLAFNKMSPRTDSPRTKAEKARFQVFMYAVPDATKSAIAEDVHFHMEFGSMVSRDRRNKGHLVEYDPELKAPHILAKGTSLDNKDLVSQSRVLNRRQICSADMARSSPRRAVTGLEHVSDMLTDPDAVTKHVFPKHISSPRFQTQLPHKTDTKSSSCKTEVYDVVYDATTESRHQRHVQVAGSSNHDDVTSFGNQAARRLAHGDVVDIVDSPRIDATRPRTGRSVPDFCREGPLRRAASQHSPIRPELENPDPEAVRPRVTGDPLMATCSSRAQHEKRFPSGTKPLDVVYKPTCSYTAELLQPPHVHVNIATQVTRKQPAASRVAAKLVNLDPTPAPGAYDPIYHYLSASPPKGRPAAADALAT